MKNAIWIFLLFPLLFSCQRDTQIDKQATLSPLGEELHRYFDALTSLGKFNGVLYVTANKKDVIKRAYNLDTAPNSTTHVRIESQFDIHSISKLMAYYLILELEQEGLINREESIKKFIPDFPKAEQITIDMLLNHTAGLARSLDGFKGNKIDLTPEQIIDYAKKQPLVFEPGTDARYSNIGYQIIYYVLATISQKSFAQHLTDALFKPLGMNDSGAHFFTREKNLKNLAKNHQYEDGQIVQIANVLDDESRTSRIFSTATDLNKFLNHIQQEPYASILKNENEVIEKNGGSDGIRAQIYTSLDHDYNYVLLTNYEAIPFQQTIADLSKILEGKPYEIPKELNRKSIDLSPEIMGDYVGTYSFPDLSNIELTFSVEDGKLIVYQDGEKAGTLKAETENIFFEDPKAPESFEFIQKEDGTRYVLMGWKGVTLKGLAKTHKQ